MFFERQVGDRCRLHSLNNALQRAFFTPDSFDAKMREFEMYYDSMEGHDSDYSREYMTEDGRTSRSWILDQMNPSHVSLHVLRAYIPHIPDLDAFTDADMALFAKPGHALAARKDAAGNWFVLDSMAGGPSAVHKLNSQRHFNSIDLFATPSFAFATWVPWVCRMLKGMQKDVPASMEEVCAARSFGSAGVLLGVQCRLLLAAERIPEELTEIACMMMCSQTRVAHSAAEVVPLLSFCMDNAWMPRGLFGLCIDAPAAKLTSAPDAVVERPSSPESVVERPSAPEAVVERPSVPKAAKVPKRVARPVIRPVHRRDHPRAAVVRR